MKSNRGKGKEDKIILGNFFKKPPTFSSSHEKWNKKFF
jgi:hypothetical protein